MHVCVGKSTEVKECKSTTGAKTREDDEDHGTP